MQFADRFLRASNEEEDRKAGAQVRSERTIDIARFDSPAARRILGRDQSLDSFVVPVGTLFLFALSNLEKRFISLLAVDIVVVP